jgi:hypothetical protein
MRGRLGSGNPSARVLDGTGCVTVLDHVLIVEDVQDNEYRSVGMSGEVPCRHARWGGFAVL